MFLINHEFFEKCVFIPSGDGFPLAAYAPVKAADEALLAGVAAALPPEERAQLARKIRPEDRARGLAARVLLALCLGRTPGADQAQDAPESKARALKKGLPLLAALRKTEAGQPVLDFADAPLISLSHCADYAACAVLPRPGGGAGIDIEGVRPLAADDYRAAFSAQEMTEIKEIKNSVDRASELIRRWTVKEAAAKALGQGFLINPQLLPAGRERAFAPAEALMSLDGARIFWRHLPGPQGCWLTLAFCRGDGAGDQAGCMRGAAAGAPLPMIRRSE